MTRTCAKCNREKPKSNFSKKQWKKAGKRGTWNAELGCCRSCGPNADCLPPHLQELDPDCEVVGVVTAADREHAARVAAVVLDGSDDTTSIG